MAVSVESVSHATFPDNNRMREDQETSIKASLPEKDDQPLQASQGRTEEAPATTSHSPPSIFSHPIWPTTAEKRRRLPHDVDGPHTEHLSCKKRRLRRDLITSRLSRPYSMPATHIINREAAAAGDKRFMKLAAVARSKKLNAVVVPTPEDYGARMPARDAASGHRPQQGPVVPLNQTGSHHMQTSSEIVRRAAILNRIRLRVRDERRMSVAEGAPCVVVSDEQGTVVSDRSLVGVDRPLANTVSRPSIAGPSRWDPAATEAEHNLHPPPTVIPPPSNPIANPSTAAADVLHLGRISPRLRPLRSPELRASRTQITNPMDDDQLDDDTLSFPSSVLFADEAADSLGDEVYADFSVIFGGLDANATSTDDDIGMAAIGEGEVSVGTEHFEDYMDDLDGIPRAVR